MQKNDQLGEFLKTCQTVLPDRSTLKGQNLVENAKIAKMRHFLVIFKQCAVVLFQAVSTAEAFNLKSPR